MRNTIITTILLFIAVIGASIYYFANLDGDKKKTLRPMTFLPKETFLIATLNNDATSDNIFKDFEIFDALVGSEAIQRWTSLKAKILRNASLQPYVDGVEMYISFHPEKEQITPLFTIPTLTPVEKADLPAIVDELRKTYQVTQKDTLGSRFFSFSGEEAADVFHVLYHEGIFFASYSAPLLHQILDDNAAKLEKAHIDYFIDNNNRNSPMSVYFIHDQIPQIAKQVLRRKSGDTLGLFEQLGGKSAWNLNFKNDALILSGESETSGKKDNYLEIYGHQAKTTQSLYNVFPESTASYLSFAISDTARFRQDLTALFTARQELDQLQQQFSQIKRDKGVSFETDLRPAFGREFAVVEQSNQTTLAFVVLADTAAWRQAAAPIVSEVADSIYRFNHANIPYALFGDPLKAFSRPYFIRLKNILVLANHQSLLHTYQQDWRRSDLLINTLGFKNFERIQGNEANITYFLRTRTAAGTVSNLLKPAYAKNFQDKDNFGYQDFYSWSVQISGNSGTFLSSIYGIYKSKSALGATPAWTYAFENRPITAPAVFEHSDTSQFILIQEQDHTVHAIHPTGKKLWSAVFHGRIVGQTQQLADRSLVSVTDRNQLYRFDPFGNSLPGFSLHMPYEPSYSPTIAQVGREQLIFVPAGRRIAVYTLEGKKVTDWDHVELDGRILFDIKVKNDRVFVGTDRGHFYQFGADGELQKEVVIEGSHFKNPIGLADNTQKQTAIYAVDTAGNLLSIDFEHTPAKSSLGASAPEAIVAFSPQGNEDARSIVAIDQKQLLLRDIQDSATHHEYTFTQIIEDRPQLFAANGGGRLLGIAVRGSSLIYLFDEQGELLDGFPVEALPGFYYGKIDYNSAPYLLCIRRDKKLYAFKN
ncbi:hypothetical protein BC792_10778 [Sphingobacterium allocomposti]|uniref:Outer membrane protein assembly factor BamB n=1 Tax=Sphingobacterium allocomposti TaxID=415956 RepID=A0A5S5DNB4_9SPHI|nr:hypothetical protein [Sphingobacterium composti Yoo et al. 2007 non Ten et al. 2007]TYP96179.1 hypothetical protein BC792_10778 [Sphingobacterium composti Yoo et al. 2007 non Ten et al. 2007]